MILEQWPSLSSYYDAHEDRNRKGHVRRAAAHLSNPLMKLLPLFLKFVFRPLNEFNTMFKVIRIHALAIVRLLTRSGLSVWHDLSLMQYFFYFCAKLYIYQL